DACLNAAGGEMSRRTGERVTQRACPRSLLRPRPCPGIVPTTATLWCRWARGGGLNLLTSPSRLTLKKKSDLFEETVGGGLMLEEQMVSAREGEETASPNACSQRATCLEWNYEVIPHMHDKRRRLNIGQKISDIEIAGDIEI